MIHCKNCESCQSQAYLEMSVLSCPVLPCPDHHDHYVHHDHHDFGDNDDHGNHEEVGGYVRKLKVVHKEVGGCLIQYNLQLACEGKLGIICIALNDESLLTHSVTQICR